MTNSVCCKCVCVGGIEFATMENGEEVLILHSFCPKHYAEAVIKRFYLPSNPLTTNNQDETLTQKDHTTC